MNPRTVLGYRAPVIGERVRLDLHQDVVIVEDSEEVAGVREVAAAACARWAPY